MKRKSTSRKTPSEGAAKTPPEAAPLGEEEQEEEPTSVDAAAVQAIASGGAKRGEPLKVIEEEDDFEDGRSSAGRHSRAEYDEWTRGDVGSRGSDTHSGVLSVEGERDDRAFHAGARSKPSPEPEEVVEPVVEHADYSALEYEGLRGEEKTFDFRKAGGTRSSSPKKRSRKGAPKAGMPPPADKGTTAPPPSA